MRRKTIFLILLAIVTLAGYSCSLFGGGSDEPVEVQLTVSTEPEDAGNVNITSRTFNSGDSVSVTASPNNGFSFNGWSGNLQSQNNPFEFIIQSDTDLIANFFAVSSIYTVNFTVSDATDAIELQFGLLEEATSGFDQGSDFESPPPPPQNALHAYFQTGNIDLLRDFRNSEEPSAEWLLELQPSPADSLILSWSVDDIVFNGSLILSVPDISEEFDMTEVTELKVHKNEVNNLSVNYLLGD